MKYKKFGCIDGNPEWKIIAEFENDQLTEIHYFNINTLEVENIVKLKNTVNEYFYYIITDTVYYVNRQSNTILTDSNRWKCDEFEKIGEFNIEELK